VSVICDGFSTLRPTCKDSDFEKFRPGESSTRIALQVLSSVLAKGVAARPPATPLG
jgi:hypothetical protein